LVLYANGYGKIVAYVVVREFVFWVRRLLCWENVVINRYGLLCKLKSIGRYVTVVVLGRGSERGNVALRVRYEGSCLTGFCEWCVGASRWFPYYLTYIDDARSHINQAFLMFVVNGISIGLG